MEVRTLVFADETVESVAVMDEDGKAWYLFTAFERILGFPRLNDAVKRYVSPRNKKYLHELPNYATYSIDARFRVSINSKFITRPGLFELIFASKMPNAVRFKNWVTENLLDKLCRTGTYNMERDAPAHARFALEVIRDLTSSSDSHRSPAPIAAAAAADAAPVASSSTSLALPSALTSLSRPQLPAAEHRAAVETAAVKLERDLARERLERLRRLVDEEKLKAEKATVEFEEKIARLEIENAQAEKERTDILLRLREEQESFAAKMKEQTALFRRRSPSPTTADRQRTKNRYRDLFSSRLHASSTNSNGGSSDKLTKRNADM